MVARLPEWVRIVYDGFAEPLVLLLRAALVYGAVLAAPLPAPPAQVNAVAGPLFSAAVIALLAWGLWRSAGVCGLLFRSAQDPPGPGKQQTMVRFFERIFRALVAVLAVLAVLELFGVPVAGLLAGAGVARAGRLAGGAEHAVQPDRGCDAGHGAAVRHRRLHRAGTFEGTVEEISFRSTKIRTPDNCVISVENSKVSAEYIQNVTNRSTRLWNFRIGVTYAPGAAASRRCAPG